MNDETYRYEEKAMIFYMPDTLVDVDEDVDDDDEWHIEKPWNRREGLCGTILAKDASLPDAEVPDEMTCPKCLSISNSVLHRYITEPFMKFKIWLVGLR